MRETTDTFDTFYLFLLRANLHLISVSAGGAAAPPAAWQVEQLHAEEEEEEEEEEALI